MADVIPLHPRCPKNRSSDPRHENDFRDMPVPPWERDALTARRFDRLIEKLKREREANMVSASRRPVLRVVRP